MTAKDVLAPYVEHVMGFIDPSIVRPFNVVLDAGSGMARPGRAETVRTTALPRDEALLRHRRAVSEPRGEPAHRGKPARHRRARWSPQKADIGIAWDGDADRCFFIDGTGGFVSGDFVTALLAEAFLIKYPGASIIYDLRASYAVRDVVARYGGTSLMNRVGHAFFKRRMRETNAIFGGEVTGHYYFRDNFYADNGFIPALLDPGADVAEGTERCTNCCGRSPAAYFISGEINTKLASMDLVPAKLDAARREVRRRARIARSTASRSSIPTGTSTSGRRTPSRCCG